MSGVHYQSLSFAPDGNPLSRRGFLRSSFGAGLAAAGFGQLPLAALAQRSGKKVSPNERITSGGIGIGNRGTYDLGCFLEQKDVQFVAVCDVKEARRDAVKKIADDQVRQPGLRSIATSASCWTATISMPC